jgi:hypothetical protein
VTDIERSAWLTLLKAERSRRAARVEWQAGEDERARDQVIDTLRQMAQRLGASAQRVPLDVSDMSNAELLAVRWFLPEQLQPPGLPSEAAILARMLPKRG